MDAALAEAAHLLRSGDRLAEALVVVEGAVDDVDHLDLGGGGGVADALHGPLRLLVGGGPLDAPVRGVVLEPHGDADDVLRRVDDLVRVLDADGALDQAEQQDGALLDLQDLADLLLEGVDLLGVLDLGDDEHVDRREREDRLEVGEAQLVDAVDADHLLDVAEVDRAAQRVADDQAREVLDGRVDRVLEVEDDAVGGRAVGLGDHVRVVARDVQVRAALRAVSVGRGVRPALGDVERLAQRDVELAAELALHRGGDDVVLRVVVHNLHVAPGDAERLEAPLAHLLDLLGGDVRRVVHALDLDLVLGLPVGELDARVVDAEALAVDRLVDDVQHGAVAPLDDADDAVGVARQVVPSARLLDPEVAHLLDGHQLEAELLLALALELLEQVGPPRVDRDAHLGDDGADALAGGGDGGDVVDDAGVAAPRDRHGDDGQLGAGGGVLVSAGVVLEGAVGVRVDVAVEVDVDLGAARDHDVELVDDVAAVGRVGVLVDVGLDVRREVLAHGPDGRQVERLAGGQLADEALLEHVDEDARGAAVRHAGADALLRHAVGQPLHGGQRGAAGARLEDELGREEAQRVHQLGAGLADVQRVRVGRDAGGAADDLGRVADAVHLDDVVDVVLGDRDRGARVLDEVVGDDDDVLRELGVDGGVGERAARVSAVHAVAVALVVGLGRGDEGDVDLDVALLDRADTGAVRAHDHGLLQVAGGDRQPERAVRAGLDLRDRAVLEHPDELLLPVVQRGRREVDVLEAHLADDLHHRDEHAVAAAQVVVERDGHPVVRAALLERLLDRRQHLGAPREACDRAERRARLGRGGLRRVGAGVRSRLAVARDLLRDLSAGGVNPVVAVVFDGDGELAHSGVQGGCGGDGTNVALWQSCTVTHKKKFETGEVPLWNFFGKNYRIF